MAGSFGSQKKYNKSSFNTSTHYSHRDLHYRCLPRDKPLITCTFIT